MHFPAFNIETLRFDCALLERAIVAEEKHSQTLDLSEAGVRVTCVLRNLGIETVEQLLLLSKVELLALRNCGLKTTAKILELQAGYGKDLVTEKDRGAIDIAVQRSRAHMNRLIVVTVAANELIEGTKKSDRYYYYVTKQRFNMLRRALEAFRKQ